MDDDLPAIMSQIAEDAVAFAAQSGFSLDYSEASLVEVDRLLTLIKEEEKGRTDSPDDYLWKVAQVMGAYLGEVVVREMGGAWQVEERGDDSARMLVVCSGVQMFPMDKVYKQLSRDEFDAVQGYLRALRVIIKRQDKR